MLLNVVCLLIQMNEWITDIYKELFLFHFDGIHYRLNLFYAKSIPWTQTHDHIIASRFNKELLSLQFFRIGLRSCSRNVHFVLVFVHNINTFSTNNNMETVVNCTDNFDNNSFDNRHWNICFIFIRILCTKPALLKHQFHLWMSVEPLLLLRNRLFIIVYFVYY